MRAHKARSDTVLLASDSPPRYESRPRSDVELLAQTAGIEFVPKPPDGLLRPLENLVSSDLGHAFRSRSLRPSVCLSLSERLASASIVANWGSRQICVAHNFNRARRTLQQFTHWMHRLDSILVVSTRQRDVLIEAGIDSRKIKFIADYVDTEFFDPSLCRDDDDDLPGSVPDRYVLSVGQERRDYSLLLGALAASGVPAVILPSSAWVASGGLPDELPPNVTVLTGLSFRQLRRLYHQASAVVVPVIADTEYAAGVNGLLEALSMARPVIVSRTCGLRDYLNSDYMNVIPAGDHDALVKALHDHDRRPGEPTNYEGRRAALNKFSLERYVKDLRVEIAWVSELGSR